MDVTPKTFRWALYLTRSDGQAKSLSRSSHSRWHFHWQCKLVTKLVDAVASFIKSWVFRFRPIDRGEISAKKSEFAGVAQLVEHPICNRAVGSSSLSASTISPIAPCVNTLICRHIICQQVITDAQSDVHKMIDQICG